jgi:glycosyltransferase involved in cell wall biosynthesis
MKVVYFYADNGNEWNCSEWRCAIPARALNKSDKHHADVFHIGQFVDPPDNVKAACEAADVIVIERMLLYNLAPNIQHLKSLGKTLVCTFDDAYHYITPFNPAYPYWIEGRQDRNGTEYIFSPLPIEQFGFMLPLFDGVTVPSPVLAADFGEYAPIQVLPNYLEWYWYEAASPPPRHPDFEDKIIIGWGASLSHIESFVNSHVLDGIMRALAKRPRAVIEIFGDQRLFDMIMLPQGRKAFQPYVPIQVWPSYLKTVDIGIAPLAGEYDRRRSWIKPLEYCALGIPWIASRSDPYDEIGKYGVIVDNTPDAWETALINMIDRLDMYRKRARVKPLQFAMRQTSDRNVERIVEIYEGFKKCK